MTRVSLKEAYDNKDVVAQIYAIRDIAEGAEDTANNAVSTANTASEHVDALVPRVEGAVQNANNASASAQASAQTVTGYENRLSAVENETAGLDSDLGAVTLRVTTAEGQIVTIQGRVTALESADAQNVKISGAQNITGIKTVPTEATGSRSQQIANSAKVGAELDAYDAMVRTTGNQMIGGEKTFTGFLIHPFQKRDFAISQSSNTPWVKLIEYPTSRRQIRGRIESTSGKAFFIVDNNNNTSPTVRVGGWGLPADSVAFTFNDNDSKVGLWFKVQNYGSIKIYIDDIGNYSVSDSWSYLTVVSPLTYKALPEGDHITYSTVWTVVQ